MNRERLILSVVTPRSDALPVRDPRLPAFGRLWMDLNRVLETARTG